MAKNLQLSGLIHANYDNESAMAQAMGWSRQRLNRITTGKRLPDLNEVQALADALNTSFSSMAQIFLGGESTNVDDPPIPMPAFMR